MKNAIYVERNGFFYLWKRYAKKNRVELTPGFLETLEYLYNSTTTNGWKQLKEGYFSGWSEMEMEMFLINAGIPVKAAYNFEQ